jgi:NADPH2:quinone reductase
MGARVIAAASSEDKLALCRRHGAAETIDYTREDLRDRIKALTSGNGVDVVYDPVGGTYAEPALRGTAWNGRYLVVGFASGEIPKIPLNLVLLKGCQIVGVFWGSFAMREPARNRDHCARIFEWVSVGKLTPHVDGVMPFTEAAAALVKLEQRQVKGKLVLVP